eukprot:gene30252-39468_t
MQTEEAPSVGFLESISKKWQYLLDKSSPLVLYRWIFFLCILSTYVLRVYYVNGWFIVTYGLGIYLLNQFIGFLSPQIDPEETDIDVGLPTREKEEFRPFARRLPEFKFWYSCSRAIIIATFMTFFELFDRQIRHMIKYKYVPFSWGKAKYVTTGSKPAGEKK